MKKKLTFLLTILLSLNFAFGQGFYVEQPITWDYKIIQIDGDTYRIDIIGEFSNEEWHIYDMEQYPNGPISTSLKLNSNEYIELIGSPYISSEIKKAYDSNFKMNIGTTVGDVILSQKIKIKDISKAAATANIEWQACRHSECLPPTDEDITINFNNDQELIAATKINKAATSPEKESNLLGLILEAIAWGLVMLLTPCVFPMVPMTVSFFLKKNQNNKAKGKFYASLFGAFIVALYTIPIAVIILITYFAGGEAITADIFNFLATHWIPNILFFAIFIVFAASFFGAFEIVMPSSLVNKTDSKSDKGGIIGVFFMALTLVLVSFSCTGPIVGTVLIKSTQGEFWEPIVTMLAFSIAFALPFTIFAFSPSLLKNLPKSGGWLNSVKVTLGFIEVALGFKFLSVADQTYHWGLLDREVYLAIWIVCFTLLGLYLLGKLKFKYDSPLEYVTIPRLALAITSFSFVIYMLPGMWGAPLKALSGYLPPITTQDFVINTNPTIGANTYQDSPKNVKYGDFLKLPHNMQRSEERL